MRSGRDDLGGKQTWRPEHKEISAAPKLSARKKSFQADHVAGSRPKPLLGKADDTEEETGICTLWDRRGMGSSIQGKILRITSGKSRWQQLIATCTDPSNEAKAEEEGSRMGLAHESVGAMTEE